MRRRTPGPSGPARRPPRLLPGTPPSTRRTTSGIIRELDPATGIYTNRSLFYSDTTSSGSGGGVSVTYEPSYRLTKGFNGSPHSSTLRLETACRP